MERVLIAGISGLVGSHIAQALTEGVDNIHVTGLVRSSFGAEKQPIAGVDFVPGDLTDEQSMAKAVHGCSQLIIAVSAKAGLCDEIEHRGVVRAAKAAEQAGVRRIIYISGASTPYAPRWFEAGSAKKKAEQELVRLSTEVVILRPSWLMESLERFERNGGMSLIGSGEAKIHWLAAADLAQIVKYIVTSPQSHSGVRTILGPQAISLSEAAARYSKARNLSGKIQTMPLWMGRLLSMFLADLKPAVELASIYEKFDESRLPVEDFPFPKPRTMFSGWLGKL